MGARITSMVGVGVVYFKIGKHRDAEGGWRDCVEVVELGIGGSCRRTALASSYHSYPKECRTKLIRVEFSTWFIRNYPIHRVPFFN